MYRALYDFNSTSDGYLTFVKGDDFTLLGEKRGDWLLAQNGFGEIGFIPSNYIQKDEKAPLSEVIKSIDRAIQGIHYAATSSGSYTHQQRENLKKLTQHREDVLQSSKSSASSTSSSSDSSRRSSRRVAPPPPTRSSNLSPTIIPINQQHSTASSNPSSKRVSNTSILSDEVKVSGSSRSHHVGQGTSIPSSSHHTGVEQGTSIPSSSHHTGVEQGTSIPSSSHHTGVEQGISIHHGNNSYTEMSTTESQSFDVVSHQFSDVESYSDKSNQSKTKEQKQVEHQNNDYDDDSFVVIDREETNLDTKQINVQRTDSDQTISSSPSKQQWPNTGASSHLVTSPSRFLKSPSVINFDSITVPKDLASDMVEQLRKHTGLSYPKSCLAVEVVLGQVAARIPQTASLMDRILMTFSECQRNVLHHLQLLNSTDYLSRYSNIPESLLILYRCGFFNISETLLKLPICNSHREYLGIYWKRTKNKCSHPLHPPSSKAKPDRGASLQFCKQLWLSTRNIVPVGAGLCKQCSQKQKKQDDDSVARFSIEDEIEQLDLYTKRIEDGGKSNTDTVLSSNADICSQTGQSCSESIDDGRTESQTYSVASSQEDWFTSNVSPKEKLTNILNQLSNNSFGELRSQLMLPFHHLQKSAKYYYTSKANEAIMIILEIIAPGQANILYDEIFKTKHDNETTDSLTKQLIDAYNQSADKRTQLQILSLFVNKYTKQKLMTLIPSITSSKIDVARRHASLVGPGQILNPPKVYRIRLTKPKLLHFIEYVSSPAISQVLGFGQTEIQLSTGVKIEMPKVVRNAVDGRIITSYQSYCKEIEFSTFSRASLYRILKTCKAAKKKSLHGLDNTTADGINALESLLKVVNRLEVFGLPSNIKELLVDMINICSQHLKFEMKSHLSKNSTCADHCTSYCLSDEKEHEFASICEHSHSDTCSNCTLTNHLAVKVNEALESIEIGSTDIKQELIYDIKVATKNIQDWKAHLIRTVHQDFARQSVLEQLKHSQALLIMDWAMKMLPLQFRETQSNFFGKRGISWHVSCLITRNGLESPDNHENFDLNSFVHILDNGTQGWFSIAHILVDLLYGIKVKIPEITEIYIKSDNAGCYHCVPLIAFICQNNNSFPIKVKEYNFSEAQSGKDLCDSKTGSCRMHIARYMNEGNDVLTPSDLKKALDSNGGVKGTHISVVSVNQDKEPKIRAKLAGISLINNFTFESDKIILRKAYNLGSGKVVKSTSLKDKGLEHQNMGGFEVLEPFHFNSRVGKMQLSKTIDNSTPNVEMEQDSDISEPTLEQQNTIFSCPDASCIKAYISFQNLERHLALGNHSYKKNSESGLDVSAKLWAETCTSVRVKYNSIIEQVTVDGHENALGNNQGWALKSMTKSTRFTAHVKMYLYKIFEQCSKSGKRPNYNGLSEELKKTCDDNGHRKFSTQEWLTPNQIRGVFSNYINKHRKTVNSGQILSEETCLSLEEAENIFDDEELAEVVMDLKAEEHEQSVSLMYKTVYENVNIS